MECKVDLIVIGFHKPVRVRTLLGSAAARVVRHANCPVHTKALLAEMKIPPYHIHHQTDVEEPDAFLK